MLSTLNKDGDRRCLLLRAMERGMYGLHSFHMPAHCGNNNICKYLNNSLILNGGAAIECTTDGDFGHMGNFNPPTGIYKEVLDQATLTYNTKMTLFSVNGSTGSLISMIIAFSRFEGKVLLQRNSHRSLIHGSRFAGYCEQNIIFFNPEFNHNFDVFLPAKASDIAL